MVWGNRGRRVIHAKAARREGAFGLAAGRSSGTRMRIAPEIGHCRRNERPLMIPAGLTGKPRGRPSVRLCIYRGTRRRTLGDPPILKAAAGPINTLGQRFHGDSAVNACRRSSLAARNIASPPRVSSRLCPCARKALLPISV